MVMLAEQRQRSDLDQAMCVQCDRVVIARTGGLLDTSSAWPQVLPKYVLERLINCGGRADRETLLADLTLRLEEMGSFWDPKRGQYHRFDDFLPAQRPFPNYLRFNSSDIATSMGNQSWSQWWPRLSTGKVRSALHG